MTHSTSAILKAVKGSRKTVEEALELLKGRADVQTSADTAAPTFAKAGRSAGWFASIHAGLLFPQTSALDLAPTLADPLAQANLGEVGGLPLGSRPPERRPSAEAGIDDLEWS
jgi:hypothetical protein